MSLYIPVNQNVFFQNIKIKGEDVTEVLNDIDRNKLTKKKDEHKITDIKDLYINMPEYRLQNNLLSVVQWLKILESRITRSLTKFRIDDQNQLYHEDLKHIRDNKLIFSLSTPLKIDKWDAVTTFKKWLHWSNHKLNLFKNEFNLMTDQKHISIYMNSDIRKVLTTGSLSFTKYKGIVDIYFPQMEWTQSSPVNHGYIIVKRNWDTVYPNTIWKPQNKCYLPILISEDTISRWGTLVVDPESNVMKIYPSAGANGNFYGTKYCIYPCKCTYATLY